MSALTLDFRRRAFAGLRIAVSSGAFVYLFCVINVHDLWDALGHVSPWLVVAAVGIASFSMVLGAVRWRALMRAYEAPGRPSLGRLVGLYFVGFFYNTYLPGGIGGDVVRGIATREAFGPSGTTGGMAIVLVERILGMAALFLLATTVLLVHPIAGLRSASWFGVFGLAMAAAGLGSLMVGRRLAPWLPWKLKQIAAQLPTLRRWGPFTLALGLSLVSQFLTAVIGYLFMGALSQRATFDSALVIVPLAAATAFVPITVGGAGAREATFVTLYRMVGVSASQALAGSLLLFLAGLIVAAGGGLLTLVVPFSTWYAKSEGKDCS